MGLIEPGAQAAEYHEQEKCGGPDECLIAAGAALGEGACLPGDGGIWLCCWLHACWRRMIERVGEMVTCSWRRFSFQD